LPDIDCIIIIDSEDELEKKFPESVFINGDGKVSTEKSQAIVKVDFHVQRSNTMMSEEVPFIIKTHWGIDIPARLYRMPEYENIYMLDPAAHIAYLLVDRVIRPKDFFELFWGLLNYIKIKRTIKSLDFPAEDLVLSLIKGYIKGPYIVRDIFKAFYHLLVPYQYRGKVKAKYRLCKFLKRDSCDRFLERDEFEEKFNLPP